MKILNLFYKYFFYIFMFWMIVLSKTAVANEVLEDRVKKLAIELRCMTCQNQSIYDSESEFSKDIIKVIEKKFTEGMNEE